jgi:hypothetical protein
MKEYKFKVETKRAGQPRPYADSEYVYEVTSDCSERVIKAFCNEVLRKSYPRSEMPNPFAGELVRFENITNNNAGKSFYEEKDKEDTYIYHVREEYTG